MLLEKLQHPENDIGLSRDRGIGLGLLPAVATAHAVSISTEMFSCRLVHERDSTQYLRLLRLCTPV
jgi:hypothetical protein